MHQPARFATKVTASTAASRQRGAEEVEIAKHQDRTVARMRVAWWRGNLQAMANTAREFESRYAFEPALVQRLTAVVVHGRWKEERDALRSLILSGTSTSQRRRAFLAQIGAEAAGHAGDTDTCNEMIEHAMTWDLYDLHWFDRCPLLEATRQTARAATARATLLRRAEAILDALYGDREALSDTVALPQPHEGAAPGTTYPPCRSVNGQRHPGSPRSK